MTNTLDELFNKYPDPVLNITIALGAIFTGLLIKLILSRIFSYYARVSGLFLIRTIIRHLHKVMYYFLPLLMLNLSVPLMRMRDSYHGPISKGIEILYTIVFAIILIQIVEILEDLFYHQFDLNKDDNLKERKIRTQLQFIRKVIIVLIVIVTAGVVLLSFENMRKVGAGLLTGVGIGSIIIGFAGQRSLANLLAGFQIAFTQPIRIDDVLIVENEWGRVEEITLTYVVVKIWDQRRLILPINYFIEKPFQNWTRVTAELIGSVFLYLDYTAPVEKIKEELGRLLEANSLWDRRVMALQVTDTRENSIEIRALVSGRNSSDVFDLRCHVREGLITFIQKNYPDSLPKTRAEIETGRIKPDL